MQRSPQWKHTAIFITYDDCGFFYDHVKPPAHLGIRMQMIVVSPWAKSGGTDRRTAVVPYSMLAFVEYDFRLRHLSANVDKVYDYRHAFDFRHHPHLSRITVTNSDLPRSERRELAATPVDVNDPT